MVFGLILIALVSILTGLLSGLLGIGGNIIAIPALVYIFHKVMLFPTNNAMHLAIGTCMLVMVFTTIAASRAHYLKGNIELSIFKRLFPMMVIGDILGAMSANLINGVILEKIFGIFLLLVSLQMLLKRNTVQANQPLKTVSDYVVYPLAFIIGFKSGLLGIGGGTMIIPFLFYLHYPSNKVSGTTALCSLTIAFFGALTFLMLGKSHDLNIAHSIGFIYIPAVFLMVPITFLTAKIGVKWSLTIAHNRLKKIFGALLLLLGIRMLFF